MRTDESNEVMQVMKSERRAGEVGRKEADLTCTIRLKQAY